VYKEGLQRTVSDLRSTSGQWLLLDGWRSADR